MSAASEPVVTVPVTMPLALYRRILARAYYDSLNTSLDVSAAIVKDLEGEVQAWQEAGAEPKQYLAEFERELDGGQYSTVYPPPLAVTLDPEAARLVRWVHADDPDCTLADMVNGGLRFAYGEDTEEACVASECVVAARTARLGREAA